MLSRSIENLKNQIKPCLCQKKTMVMQSFFPRFLPRKRLKIHKYCGSISFLSSPLWLKTSEIFRHMANIFAFGDVASGQRQRCTHHQLELLLSVIILRYTSTRMTHKYIYFLSRRTSYLKQKHCELSRNVYLKSDNGWRKTNCNWTIKQEAQGPWRLSTALQKISYKCVRECISIL